MKKPITRHESAESLYDSDFYAWTRKVSEAIRNSSLSVEDAEYAAEEIADMGKRDRRELRSRMTVLVMHLMKWAAQPRNSKGSAWLATIQEQRDQVTDLLDDSPSLRVSLIAELPIIYLVPPTAQRARPGSHSRSSCDPAWMPARSRI